jgi:hypothetical protein
MFDHNSRYYAIADAVYHHPDGREIKYKQRRFLPLAHRLPLFGEEIVQVGDRPDTITARTLGDPLQYWRVCDANNTMNPFDLTATIGARVRIPTPHFAELD